MSMRRLQRLIWVEKVRTKQRILSLKAAEVTRPTLDSGRVVVEGQIAEAVSNECAFLKESVPPLMYRTTSQAADARSKE